MRVEGKDYTKQKDDVLVIKLPDLEQSTMGERIRRFLGMSDGGFEVSILPPTKGLYDELTKLVNGISDVGDGKLEAEEFDLDGALSTVARLMSRNVERREVTPHQLEAMGFDLEDVGEFVGSYIFFVNALVTGKN